MDKVRIGLIGAGNIANIHLDAYRDCKDAEVVAICDINAERMAETAKKYNIEKTYSSCEEMIKNEKLDAADVCVWNCNHAKCAITALKAGLNVMCEKPMAYSYEEAVEMERIAKENNKLLMVGFVLRFSDENRVAKDFIDNGYMGDIYYSKATYLRRHGNPCGWFSNKELSGGGPVIDVGVHVIDQTRYLMGNPKPVSVYATTFSKLGSRPNIKTNPGWMPAGSSTSDPCTVEDLATALIRYDNGAVTSLEASYSLNNSGSITSKEIYGTKGGMSLAGEPKFYMEMNDYLVDVTPKIEYLKNSEEMFHSEINHFVDCVKNGTKCLAPGEDGVVIMKILDAIYESARTGHEVIL